MGRYRVAALVALGVIAVVGAVLIVIVPAIVPSSQEELTAERLILFLGPIVTFLIAAAKVTSDIADVQQSTNETREIVNGERKRLHTVVMAAIADHPDIAVKAQEVGLTFPTTDATNTTEPPKAGA